jgi:hypothetical protein
MEGLLLWYQAHPHMTGIFWSDLFVTVAIIIPHIVTVVLAVLTYRGNLRNQESLREVKKTLNGKADNSTKEGKKVEASE